MCCALVLIASQTASEPALDPLGVLVLGRPDSARTHAVAELLRTEFARVVVDGRDRPSLGFPDGPWVRVVVEPRGAVVRPPEARAWNAPRVWIGSAARIGSRSGWFVGGEDAVPVGDARSTGHRVWPDGGARLPMLPEHAMEGFTARTDRIADTPDARIVAESIDANDNPVALVWHQGNQVAFGPDFDSTASDTGWRRLFLDCVLLAGSTASSGDQPLQVRTEKEPTLGHDVGSTRFLEQLVDDLNDDDPLVRADARRQLARHVDGGPDPWEPSLNKRAGAYACWLDEIDEAWTFFPVDATWKHDPGKAWRAEQDGASLDRVRWRPSVKETLFASPMTGWWMKVVQDLPGPPHFAGELLDELERSLAAKRPDDARLDLLKPLAVLCDRDELDAPLRERVRGLVPALCSIGGELPLAIAVAHDADGDWMPLLLELLDGISARDAPRDECVRLAAAIASLGEPGFEALRLWADGRDERSRELARLGTARSVAVDETTLRAWLNDPVRRAWAIEVLGRAPNETWRFVEAVESLAETGPLAAVDLLGALGPDATDGLHASLASEEPWWRRAAAFAAATRPDAVGSELERWSAAAERGDPWVRAFVIAALGRASSMELESLRSMLESGSWAESSAVRHVATWSLERRDRDPAHVLSDWSRFARRLEPEASFEDLVIRMEQGEAQAARELVAGHVDRLLHLPDDPRDLALAEERRVLAQRLLERELEPVISSLVFITDERDWQNWGLHGRALGWTWLEALEGELLRSNGVHVRIDALGFALEEYGDDAAPVVLTAILEPGEHAFALLGPIWDTVEETAAALAPFVAMRFAREVVLGPWDGKSPSLADEPAFQAFWLTPWRALGPQGTDALTELGTHPDHRVRDAAARILASLRTPPSNR